VPKSPLVLVEKYDNNKLKRRMMNLILDRISTMAEIFSLVLVEKHMN